METINLTIYGVELIVSFEYDKGEPRTHEYPGTSESVEIETVCAKDSNVNLYDVLHDMAIERIENLILESKN